MPEVDSIISVLIEKDSNGLLSITRLYQSGDAKKEQVVLPAVGTGYRNLSAASPAIGKPRSETEAEWQNNANNSFINDLVDNISRDIGADKNISGVITAKSVTIDNREFDGAQLQAEMDKGYGPIYRTIIDMAGGLTGIDRAAPGPDITEISTFTKDEYDRLIQSLIAPDIKSLSLSDIENPIKIENKPAKPDLVNKKGSRPSRQEESKAQLARVEQSKNARRVGPFVTTATEQGPPEDMRAEAENRALSNSKIVIFDKDKMEIRNDLEYKGNTAVLKKEETFSPGRPGSNARSDEALSYADEIRRIISDSVREPTLQTEGIAAGYSSVGYRVDVNPTNKEDDETESFRLSAMLESAKSPTIAGISDLLEETRINPNVQLDRTQAIILGKINNKRIYDKNRRLVTPLQIEGMDRVELLRAMIMRGFQIANLIRGRWYLLDGDEIKPEGVTQSKPKKNPFSTIDFD